MTHIWRLLLVVAVAVVAFVVAVVSFKGAPAEQCQQDADRDPSYSSVSEEAAAINDESGYDFSLSVEGRPLTGAAACVRAGLGGSKDLPQLAVFGQATEVAPGRYQAPVVFTSRGEWEGRVVATPRGGDPVEIPVTIDVGGPPAS